MSLTEKPVNPLLIGEKPFPLLVIISGPSGVGKDSVLMRMRELGFPFHFVVTATSRPPRPGEIPGIDYHFVSPQRFEEMIAQDEFLEWARVYGQYKGVPKFEVRKAHASGRNVVMRLNVEGAATIKRIVPGAVLIYIAPASLEELRHRLTVRGTDDVEAIEGRLAMAQQEFEQIVNFDYVVINHEDRLDETVGHICSIIAAEQHQVFPRQISL